MVEVQEAVDGAKMQPVRSIFRAVPASVGLKLTIRLSVVDAAALPTTAASVASTPDPIVKHTTLEEDSLVVTTRKR